MAEAKPETRATSTPSPRVARKRNQRREMILRSAALAFTDMGYHGASLEDIAERLDLTRASLYHYFPSKDALLSSCLTVGADQATGRLEETLEAYAEEPAAVRLQALIETQLDTICRQDPELSRLFLTPIDWPEGIRGEVKRLRERHDRCFRKAIDDGIATGEFTTTDPALARHCMHGAINYAPVWLRGSDSSFNAQAKAIAESLVLLVYPRKGRGSSSKVKLPSSKPG